MLKKTIATLSLILALTAFGCTEAVQEEHPKNIETILEEHPEVYIPYNTEWERTLYSGPVEQHELITLLPQSEFMEEVKEGMTEWTLADEHKNGLQFTNNDLRISYNISPSEENVTDYNLFIEPVDLFEDNEENTGEGPANEVELELAL